VLASQPCEAEARRADSSSSNASLSSPHQIAAAYCHQNERLLVSPFSLKSKPGTAVWSLRFNRSHKAESVSGSEVPTDRRMFKSPSVSVQAQIRNACLRMNLSFSGFCQSDRSLSLDSLDIGRLSSSCRRRQSSVAETENGENLPVPSNLRSVSASSLITNST